MENLSIAVQSDSAFVADSIKMMISQVRAVRWCLVNISLSQCLNELSNATQFEASLVADPDSPPLLFIRSAELFALFLLRIYNTSRSSSLNVTYNGTIHDISQFPHLALSLCREQNLTAPYRPVNLLLMLRAYQFLNDAAAVESLSSIIKERWVTDSSMISQSVIGEITLTTTSGSPIDLFQPYHPLCLTTLLALLVLKH